MSPALLVAALSAVLDALVAGVLLLRGGAALSTRRLLQAASGSAAFFVAKAFVLTAVLPRPSPFLLVLLGYAYLAAALPLVGLAALVAGRRRGTTPLVRWTARLALLGVPAALWCTFVEPFRLTFEQVPVPLAQARAGTTPLRVGVLADVQANTVTDFEREAVARMLALRPDLILIPGDLAQVWPRDLAELEQAADEFRALVAPLEAPLGVWMVLGNSDSEAVVRRAIEGTAVRLLENERVELVHRDRRITLCGMGRDWRDPRAAAAAAALEALPGDDDVRLLLVHFPDAVEHLQPDSRVDLLVAGHTHGGQVQLPWIGPPITLSRVPRRVAAGGLSELSGRRVYVSRGIGVERGWAPRLRFNCPPEVSLLVLGAPAGTPEGRPGNLQAGRADLGGPP